MADVQVLSPHAAEASDGRIVIVAPAGTERVRLTIDGERASPRVVARRASDGGVRFELQSAAVDREGAELALEALGEGGAVLGRQIVSGVHLLGEGAFGSAGALRPAPEAAAAARQITSGSSALTGVSVACFGAGGLAESEARTTTRAGSTLKAAILLTALAQRDGQVSASPSFAIYQSAIVASDNGAANLVLAEAGGGDQQAGTAATNELMADVGMTDTVLDGPYIQTAGRSQKQTSARDLRLLASALLETARDGSGVLSERGVTRDEARAVLGLMSAATYPGLIREHVPEPVAHKAGWLDDQQNDLALIFGGPGGPCAVGMVTEGLSFSSADVLGEQVADQVLPALAAAGPDDTAQAPDPSETTPTAPDVPAATTTGTSTAPAPAATPDGEEEVAPVVTLSDEGDGGPPWMLIGVASAVVFIVAALVARRAQVVRQRQRRREARRRDR